MLQCGHPKLAPKRAGELINLRASQLAGCPLTIGRGTPAIIHRMFAIARGSLTIGRGTPAIIRRLLTIDGGPRTIARRALPHGRHRRARSLRGVIGKQEVMLKLLGAVIALLSGAVALYRSHITPTGILVTARRINQTRRRGPRTLASRLDTRNGPFQALSSRVLIHTVGQPNARLVGSLAISRYLIAI
ncbi:MAG: hypothetical protein LC790_14920 [Actinobacteria bacterium]|nr:hypothetical protein [Actinomycetota bacterium]